MQLETIPIQGYDNAWIEALIQQPYNPKPRPAMIVVPGGSYLYRSKREADPVMLQYATIGYQVFLLHYSTIWAKNFYRDGETPVNQTLYPYPHQVYQLLGTIAFIREHAQKLGIDPNKIFVTGFSAGGHIAASAGIHYSDAEYQKALGMSKEQIRPNGLVLCYPLLSSNLIRFMIAHPLNEEMSQTGPYTIQSIFGTLDVTEKMWDDFTLPGKVTPDFPPAFIWHTAQDQMCDPKETADFVKEILANKVSCEFHLFDKGRHGMSLSTPAVAIAQGDYLYKNAIWPILADLFLKELK